MAKTAKAAAHARRDRLVEENLWIVAPIARHIAAQVPDTFLLEDLIGTGTVALVSAANKYRPRKHGGAPFSAYARMRVRGAMLDSIRRRNWQRAKLTTSIDEAQDFPTPQTVESDIDRDRLLGRVCAAIDQLPEPSRKLIRLYYANNQTTLAALGEIFGINHQRMSDLHLSAIRELRVLLGVR